MGMTRNGLNQLNCLFPPGDPFNFSDPSWGLTIPGPSGNSLSSDGDDPCSNYISVLYPPPPIPVGFRLFRPESGFILVSFRS